MKNRKVLLFAIPLIFLMACNGSETKKQSADTKKDTVCKNDDWKLAVQAWSFHKFSFCEAVDKAKKAGFKYMEAYPGQKVYKDKEQSTYFTMGEELKQFIKDTLSKAGIELVAYGVVKCDSAYKWEQVFSF